MSLSIRAKFALALVLVSCLFGLAVASAWRDIRRVEAKVAGLYSGPMLMVDVGRATQRDFMDLRRHYLSASLSPSPRWAPKYQSLRDRLSGDLDSLAKRLYARDEQDRLDHARAVLADWDGALARGDFSLHQAQIDRLADSFQGDIDMLIEGAEKDARGRVDEVGLYIQSSRSIILTGGTMAIVLGLGVMLILAGNVVRPIELAARIASSVAAGRFQDEMPQDRSDEPGQLLRALMLMRREIQAQQHELARRNFELERIASSDKLTGLYNRRKLEEFGTEYLAGLKRYGGTLSAILIDIDHFKAVNDTHGHATGDLVLMHVGSILSEAVRDADMVGRWGGEEFLVLLPSTTLDGAEIVAEKIRQSIAVHEFPTVGSKSASFGVSQILEGETMTGLVARADLALYQAKQEGRNRVVVDRSTMVKHPIAPPPREAVS
jgi:diguanylate cyclase (GGDEF)-like protein